MEIRTSGSFCLNWRWRYSHVVLHRAAFLSSREKLLFKPPLVTRDYETGRSITQKWLP